MKEIKADVGVIVGRFQVPYLHEAHLDLLNTVDSAHNRMIVVLGKSPCLGTANNPLDFEARRFMINEHFPKATVQVIDDVPGNNLVWSTVLDAILDRVTMPKQTLMLYGSRDSFINCYEGEYPTTELESEAFISGTAMRDECTRRVEPTADFRAGVIWATGNRYPTAFPTVDVAVVKFRESGPSVLLCRKPHQTKYQFIGGFADPMSECFEHDARREVMEESGIEISEPEYMGSARIDDSRYAKEQDRIKTLFFKATYIYGRPTASDDVEEVRWFKLPELIADINDDGTHHCLGTQHVKLLKILAEKMELNPT